MTHHIKEFTVHDYKGIHELTLKDIAPINILTGDNNSGKTSLLELLVTTGDPLSLRNWVPALRIIFGGYYGYYYGPYFEGFCNLFPCNQDEDKSMGFEWIDSEEQHHTIQMEGIIFSDQLPESEIRRMNGFSNSSNTPKDNNNEKFFDVHAIRISITHNDTDSFEGVIIDKQRRLPYQKPLRKNNNRIIYISPVEHESYNTYLNYVLKTTEYNDLLVEMLKYFDNEIKGIQAIQSDDIPGIISYQVLSNRHNQALPLNAYGDGLKKAVYLLSALIIAKNGILLIDEFETGIHTSCMDQVFNLLLENALKLNVQIFMTSHSKEAISKVLRLSPSTQENIASIQENIAVYTLYKHEGKNYVRRVNCQEAIEMQDQLGMELR